MPDSTMPLPEWVSYGCIFIILLIFFLENRSLYNGTALYHDYYSPQWRNWLDMGLCEAWHIRHTGIEFLLILRERLVSRHKHELNAEQENKKNCCTNENSTDHVMKLSWPNRKISVFLVQQISSVPLHLIQWKKNNVVLKTVKFCID